MRQKPFLLCLVALSLLATSASASNVNPGIDLWVSTGNGTAIDFSVLGQSIPAGYFCAGSPAFSGSIPLKGKNITSTPGLQGADTILERTQTAILPTVGSVDTVPLYIRVLSLQSKTPFSVAACGTSYDVFVRLDPNVSQLPGSITIRHEQANGGTYDASFTVLGQVLFTDRNTGVTLTPLSHTQPMSTSSACWSHTPGTGGITVNGPVTVDSDGDGVLDLTLPGTSNFAPGWCAPCCGGSGPPTFSPPTHTGPHGVKAPKKKCVSIRPIEDIIGFGNQEEVEGRATAIEIDIVPLPCDR